MGVKSLTFTNVKRDAVQEFEHPNGERGILIGVNTTEGELVDQFDLDVEPEEQAIVMPLKHKADGATNFETYEFDEEGNLVVEMTDDQFMQTRENLNRMV